MKLKWNIFDIFWFIIPVGMVSLGSIVSRDLKCAAVEIKLRENGQNYFLREEQILEDVQEELSYVMEGGKLIHNDLNKIENLLKRNKFVENAKVLSDHKGRVLLDIVQRRPIARIVSEDSSYYLTETGDLMPTSFNYTSRTMLLLGNKINDILRLDTLTNIAYRNEFIEMIKYINEDEFLKAQVAELELLKNGKIVLYPQVTHQKIEFGKCEEYVDKFDRLKIFYKQILPRKGWSTYSKVNLEYKNQIICE